MAKKTLKLRAWTKEDVRMLKSLAREKTKTTVIARKLKRTYAATRQQASKLGVSLTPPSIPTNPATGPSTHAALSFF
jgi:hypothetical protein